MPGHHRDPGGDQHCIAAGDDAQVIEPEQVLEVLGSEPILLRHRHLREPGPRLENRLPQKVVAGEEQPRVRSHDLLEAPEGAPDIVEVSDDVAHHHPVERLVDVEVLGVSNAELEVGVRVLVWASFTMRGEMSMPRPREGLSAASKSPSRLPAPTPGSPPVCRTGRYAPQLLVVERVPAPERVPLVGEGIRIATRRALASASPGTDGWIGRLRCSEALDDLWRDTA